MHSKSKNDLRYDLLDSETGKHLFAIMPEAVIIHDGEQILFCNPAAVSMYGAKDVDDLIGIHPNDLVHPDELEWLKKRREATSKPGIKTLPETTRRVRLDGTTFYAENTSVGIEYDGQSAYMVLSRDVTERKNIEEKLRDGEQRFHDFANFGADRFWETDENYRFTFISKSESSNRPIPSKTLGLTRWEVPGAENNEELWRGFRIILDTRRPFHDFRYFRTNQTGQKVYLRVSGKPIYDKSGDFKGYRGTTVDESSEAELKETYHLLELLLEYLPTSIVILDRDFNFIRVNDRYAKECGHDVDFFPGKNHFELYPSDAEQIFLEVREKKQPSFIHARPFEFPDNPEWGTTYWDWTLVPILDDDGEVSIYVWSITNVTEQILMQEQLTQSQKMEALGQLTGGVAHDFNNLLAIMIGNTELMEYEIGGDENTQHYLEEIKQAANSAATLTSRLLAFSRKQLLASKTTDIRGLIDDGLGDMLRRTLGEPIDLRTEHAVDLWSAMIDPHQFENALVNLAVNAKDAMPKGGVLTIETANVSFDEANAEQHDGVMPGDYVMVAVRDTGTGMTPEVMDQVFEPFFTTKDVGKGSGLGLSMVYGFVKQSEGYVSLTSEVDRGTTIKIYFPRSEDAVTQIETKDDTPEFKRGSERILIVEDDPRVRKLPASILRTQGYKVTESKDSVEAINHLKSGQSFDLLFTDVVLPGGVNGVEIAEEAKRIQPDIKILYTSGYAENAIEHNGKLVQGITLINKPYLRAELLEKIQTILETENG